MKTIAVILPVNNPDMLKQSDLAPYQSDTVNFKLSYVDTHLREINTVEEVETLLPLVVEKIAQVAREGCAAIIIYAFGEVGVLEAKSFLNIAVMALGTAAIRKASDLSSKKFTVLPGMLAHNDFLKEMIDAEKLNHNYVPAKHSPEVTPADVRSDPEILNKLIRAASAEIKDNGVDVFTLGCGSFIGIAKPLEIALQKEFGPSIKVVDPVEVTFNFAVSCF